jgi:hypothetical protein
MSATVSSKIINEFSNQLDQSVGGLFTLPLYLTQ